MENEIRKPSEELGDLLRRSVHLADRDHLSVSVGLLRSMSNAFQACPGARFAEALDALELDWRQRADDCRQFDARHDSPFSEGKGTAYATCASALGATRLLSERRQRE